MRRSAGNRLLVTSSKHISVPMMDVRSFEEAKPARTEIKCVAIPHAFDSTFVSPMVQVHRSAELARHQHRLRCFGKKPIHSTTLVGLEVSDDNVGQELGI